MTIDAFQVWNVVGALHSHPSRTAQHLGDRIAKSMWDAVEAGREMEKNLRLAAAWSSANFRDATSKHPNPVLYRALDALEVSDG